MKIKLLYEGAKAPKRADNGSAGYDCYIPRDITIHPGRNLIPLGFAMALDNGTEVQIRPRSGFSLKGVEGCNVEDYNIGYTEVATRYNADVILGTIDESYRGEVGVILNSHEPKDFILLGGTRIAQMVISEYRAPEIEIVDELNETERKGGFGHTGSM